MQTRRDFLRRAGAFALTASLPLDRTEPELILYNGNIITIDDALPRAEAVAISAGRFFAVGRNDKVQALATSRTKKINLDGKTVVPGFIDAHTHPAVAGRMHLRQVDCDLRSIAAIQKAIRERAGKTPAGQWVLGFKYDDTKTSDGRPLTLADLDAASLDHPVYISHRGGHTAYTNSLGYTAAGVTEQTADPSGGRFDRDPVTNKLNGRVSERATEVFDKAIPADYSREDYRAGVKLIAQMMSRTGITSAHDAWGTHDDLRAYRDEARCWRAIRAYLLFDSLQRDRPHARCRHSHRLRQRVGARWRDENGRGRFHLRAHSLCSRSRMWAGQTISASR